MQIESLIDQNVEISKLITLWGQKGSRVVRVNLFVIPIEDSIIYVEPLFIIAEKTELPELKDYKRGGIVGSAEIIDCVTRSASRWFFGPFGFVICNPKPLTFQPYRGCLGFFEIETPETM